MQPITTPSGLELATNPLLAQYFTENCSSRLLTLATGQITGPDRASQTGAIQVWTRAVEACMRRFLPHVLPAHVVTVRSDGLWGPGHRDALTTARPRVRVATRHGHAAGQDPDSPPPATASRWPQGTRMRPLIATVRPHGWCPLPPGPCTWPSAGAVMPALHMSPASRASPGRRP
jgi:hypothetical protein